MKEIGVGVIGAGFIGSKHAEIYASLEGCRLVGICDVNQERLHAQCEKLHCRPFTDYRELVERDDVDAVSICLPEANHVGASVDCAQRGKHILLEKPLATSLEDCDRILEAVAGSGVTFTVGHLLRFDPKYAQAYEYVRSGGIGNIVQVKAQRNGMISAGYGAGRGTSVMFHVGIHDVDLMLWFADDSPIRVSAEKADGVLGSLGTEDAVLSTVKFRKGAIGSVGASWVLNDRLGSGVNASMEIIGDKGYISIDLGAERGLRVFSDSDGWLFPDLWHWPSFGGTMGGALEAQLRHFLRCIREQTPPLVSGVEARSAVAVVLAALESASKGVPVMLGS